MPRYRLAQSAIQGVLKLAQTTASTYIVSIPAGVFNNSAANIMTYLLNGEALNLARIAVGIQPPLVVSPQIGDGGSRGIIKLVGVRAITGGLLMLAGGYGMTELTMKYGSSLTDSSNEIAHVVGTILTDEAFRKPLEGVVAYGLYKGGSALGMKLWNVCAPTIQETGEHYPENLLRLGGQYVLRLFNGAAVTKAVFFTAHHFGREIDPRLETVVLVSADALLQLSTYFGFTFNPVQKLGMFIYTHLTQAQRDEEVAKARAKQVATTQPPTAAVQPLHNEEAVDDEITPQPAHDEEAAEDIALPRAANALQIQQDPHDQIDIPSYSTVNFHPRILRATYLGLSVMLTACLLSEMVRLLTIKTDPQYTQNQDTGYVLLRCATSLGAAIALIAGMEKLSPSIRDGVKHCFASLFAHRPREEAQALAVRDESPQPPSYGTAG